MRHLHYESSWGTLFSQLQAHVWSFVLAAFLLAIVVVAILILRARNDAAQATGKAEVYEDLDGQIRALLTQAGGALNQDQIRDCLDIPVSDISRALRDLEKSGEIARRWDSGAYTYRVRLA